MHTSTAPGSLRGPLRVMPVLLLALSCHRAAPPIRVEFRSVEARGLDPARAKALQGMIRSTLPLLGPLCLSSETAAPAPDRIGCWRLHLLAEGRGENLRLGVRWQRDEGPFQERWQDWKPAHEALAGWFRLLPFPVRRDQLPRLLPRDPQELFQALDLRVALHRREGWRDAELPSARRMAAAPASLETALIHGRLHGALMVEQGLKALQHRVEAEAAFQRCLDLSPGHPEATAFFAKLRTDLGQHADALRILQTALQRHPYHPDLLRQLSYSARYAGLLDVASQAIRRLEKVSGAPLTGIENTLIYTREHGRFLEALDREGRVVGWWPVHRFWEAYVPMVEGKRELAVQHFAARSRDWGDSRFGLMGAVFESIARDQREEALQRLRRLRESIASVGYPDGEYLLKVAEACCLLGDAFGALELLQRASNQGFLCTSWCEQSPFLVPLRGMPRYRLVLEHMDSRRRILAATWTCEAFGLEGP